MRRFSITVKIWLSVGTFIIGLVISTVLGQVDGLTTENDLQRSSNGLLPAAQQAQDAEAAFEKTVKSFNLAVMTQDASVLEEASQLGASAVKSLKAMGAMPTLGPDQTQRALKSATSLETYLADARRLYGAALANATMSRETEEQMQALASRTEELRSAVESQKAPILIELNRQLTAVQVRSKEQRYVALVVVAITMIAAILLVGITVKRAIVAPILSAIRGVQGAAEEAARESGRMAESGRTLARDSQDQAASVEETSSALEEISATAAENATRAQHADTLMKDARQRVEAAAQSMNRLSGSMAAISKSSEEVAHVLKSIDEIAFQTNILALNAAVEAARAGTAGAGFSVVADEVRSLAQRAAEAARRSGDIVERTIVDVRNGVELVTLAHGTFGYVSNTIIESSGVVGQIAASIQEQSRGVESIGQAVSRIQTVTQSTAEQAHHTAEAATQMAGHARTTRSHLNELVQVMGLTTE